MTLTLVPTPIDDEGELDSFATDVLQKAALDSNSLIVVEEIKPARKRWLNWGLPREKIEQFILYNEHSGDEQVNKLIAELKAGTDVFLMSDGGLPAFCDPGRALVDLCHKSGIRVTSTPFYNSISLAIALSGFNHDRFMFEGFLPKDKDERQKRVIEALNRNETTVMMDTPYRLGQSANLLTEIAKTLDDKKVKSRQVFLALDLTTKNEQLIRCSIDQLSKKVESLGKREFILLISGR